jgi:hypothetical protein
MQPGFFGGTKRCAGFRVPEMQGGGRSLIGVWRYAWGRGLPCLYGEYGFGGIRGPIADGWATWCVVFLWVGVEVQMGAWIAATKCGMRLWHFHDQ